MSFATDPSLLQDFLTESGELIEQLDRDLVKLERVEPGAASMELLNGIFRALHTIKGAASFLALTELTGFAHAAEDALNRLRKGDTPITSSVMDVLLRSTDVVRGMLGEVAHATPITAGPPDLITRLHEITHGTGLAQPEPAAPTAGLSSAATDAASPAVEVARLDLPQEKMDLLEFMVEDLLTAVKEIGQSLDQAGDMNQRAAAGHSLAERAEDLRKTADFFGLADLARIGDMLGHCANRFTEVSGDRLAQVIGHMRTLTDHVTEQAGALRDRRALTWPLDSIARTLDELLSGNPLPAATSPAATGSAPAASAAPVTPATSPATTAPPVAAPAETTIRVEVGRLDTLLNLIGQLVLTKNRFLSLGRRLREDDLSQDTVEAVAAASSELDRLTSELQVGVMRTRMQPLAKLFERYPRVIRDLARASGKQIDLQLFGKETEVDKTVLELLADPLIHMLRNSADHGVEQPEVRVAAGKPATGVVRLKAEHQGSHVRVELTDDGKGLDRDVLGRKAVEKGLVTAEALATMSDAQVFQFIFAPGFSTADKVTDLSGRGVGMDVVRTNINKLSGTIHLRSAKGKGTTVEILIPLTVAILPALVVGVGDSLYTIPLGSIEEIVRPDAAALRSIVGTPVMRLRDRVLPLIDLRTRLSEPVRAIEPLAVVVGVGEQKVGLLVDRLIGRQEVVTKPLDDTHAAGGPFSGATIREDGTVSLILDIIALVRQDHSAAGLRQAA